MAIRQISLLLWKNWVLHKRRPWSTALEAVLPILFMLILVTIRQSDINDDVRKCVSASDPGCSFQPFTIKDSVSGSGCDTSGFRVVYTPREAANIMNLASNASIKYLSLLGVESEDALVDTLTVLEPMEGMNPGQCDVGVVFDNHVGPDFTYSLRFSSTPGGEQTDSRGLSTWRTFSAFPFFAQPGPRDGNTDNKGGSPQYALNGFLGMQHSINRAIAELQSPGAAVDFDKIQVQRFPIPPYTDDPFVNAIKFGMPLLLMLSFLFTAINIVRSIVHEKERRLKESMKMMGLRNWVHWTAWFIDFFIFLTISVFVIVVLIKGGKVLQNSDPILIFIFLMLYAISSIMFCFLVSVFFSKASTGAAAGGILWFCNYIPYSFIGPQYDTLGAGVKQGACFLSTSCMSIGANIISTLEAQGAGMTWDTLADPPSIDDNFALSSVFGMLIFDIFFYGLLTWYIEAVFPGEYGVPRPWYFPFQPSYWCGSSAVTPTARDLDHANDTHLHPDVDPASFEPEPNGLRAGISVQGLHKVFDTKVAVNRMWLNMYEGQVTALLGHNGAGKTTTMSILTGLFPPTDGTALIAGNDIRENITQIQQSLGICPQHDVLFDTLTVAEHLWFFCRLKGVAAAAVPPFVNEMIQDLELPDKRDAQAKTLSGGMKRRLSTGIALVGGSKVVILDEPTSGMDPSARRATWDLITKHKVGRTILLSTHFMDEADLLGDRIAIMADGVVRCLGTSLFLKGRYGVGYHLTLVKTRNMETQEDLCDVAAVNALVREFVPSAEMTGNVGAELTFVLPRESASRFSALFTRLEQTRVDLGIDSYGVSVTTMEEVFLRVGEYDANQQQIRTPEESINAGERQAPALVKGSVTRGMGSLAMDEDDEEAALLGGKSGRNSRRLLWQQFYAMIVKHLLHSIRNKTAILTQLLLPLFFTLIALVVVKVIPGPSNSASRQLNNLRENYKANSFIYLSNTSAGAAISDYVSTFGAGQAVVKVPPQYNSTSDFLLAFAGTFPKDVAYFNKHTEAAATLLNDTVIAWFNDYAYHSSAEALSQVSNALLRARTPAASIVTSNHPMPLTLLEKAKADAQTMMGFNLSFSILFGMSFLASSFVLFIVAERANKAKHIQFVSGVNAFSYWSSSFLWDYVNYLIPVFSIMILFGAFSVTEYTGERLGYVLVLFLLYGWALIPLMYLASYLFVNTSVAYSRLTMFNVVTGLAALLTVAIFSLINPTTSNTLKSAFLVLPNFAFGQGISDIYSNADNLETARAVCTKYAPGVDFDMQTCCDYVAREPKFAKQNIVCQTNYLSLDSPGIGRSLLVMSLEGLGFFVLVLLIEYHVFSSFVAAITKRFQPAASADDDYEEEDEDVRAERERVSARRGTNDNVLVVDGLKKTYSTGTLGCGPTKAAVRGISVGVPHGECFGLLGVNGAGKTTTFGMLTGDLSVSAGNAYVEGSNILTQMKQVRRRLGYCPQFDGLIDLMTGREILTMYARLRGVSEHRLASVVSDLITSLSLEKHADKHSRTYSGGNKRKLSTAIALIGDPAIVFLDEPTTGMDPGARRFLWNRINDYTRAGRSIVLTSHSMEECEALCTRLAIMVNGRFRCLGSVQHLKHRFGRGFQLKLKVKHERDNINAVKAFVGSAFTSPVLKEEYNGEVTYQVDREDRGWSYLFSRCAEAQTLFDLEDYSVSQTTLEQVFLEFAKHQLAEDASAKDKVQGLARAHASAAALNPLASSKARGNGLHDNGQELAVRNGYPIQQGPGPHTRLSQL
eukprot:m.199375 g.199375  ORF g.199375 m.199375 type:complete len:1762 (-) comp15490_c4_seq21:19-5304(-)